MSSHPLDGHPHLAWHRNALCLESVQLADLAQQYGTPLFVYSRAAMLSALSAYQRGLNGRQSGHPSQVCYAVKANPSLAVIQLMAQAGCGFDVVSGGEIARVLAAGGVASQIVFSGVGKSRTEMVDALHAGIGCFNVESLPELALLSHVAHSMGLRAPFSLRVNPDVDAKTHAYIATGQKTNKFGIAHDDVLSAYQLAAAMPGLDIKGMACHIGSQITLIDPYLSALDRMLDLVAAVHTAGIRLSHLDLGGGLGINYNGETPPDAEQLLRQILSRLEVRGFGDLVLQIEPGRSLVGNAGVCLTEVLYLKPGDPKNFCIVNAAMNDLPRPAMYQAFHQMVPVRVRPDPPVMWDVVGPVCESGDWLGRDRLLAVEQGDLLAVLSAGAYCMSMASNYNSRSRAAEVMVDGQNAHLIRSRETVTDQMRHERLVAR